MKGHTMKTFAELMEEFRNPGETGIPETFATDLTTAYENDISIREAAIAERETRLTESAAEVIARETEITRLKAVNYDLLSVAPKPGEPADNEETDTNSVSGIDSLFE